MTNGGCQIRPFVATVHATIRTYRRFGLYLSFPYRPIQIGFIGREKGEDWGIVGNEIEAYLFTTEQSLRDAKVCLSHGQANMFFRIKFKEMC